MTAEEVERILIRYWPTVMRHVMAGSDDVLKGFVVSIAHQAKRKDWRPSERQLSLMRRLINEIIYQENSQMELFEP